MEHHANIVAWQMLCQRKNATLKVIDMNQKGELLLSSFEKLLSPKTKMVAVCHVSNTLGTINDIEKIIALSHANHTPVLIDAAQSVPHFAVDVQALNCDFLVFSAHKICAPTGVGILYAQQKWLDVMPPYQGGGAMIDRVTFAKTTYLPAPQRFEAGTPNIADIVAMGAAIDYIQAIGIAHIAAYETELLHYATQKMQAIPEVLLIGNADHKASVISFNIHGAHPYDVGLLLDKYGIAIRTGHHCTQPIMDFYGVPGTCRASFAFYNTYDEIDYFINCLQKVIKMLA
jgi:cysteine desulfurase/selenocysteine lyase